MTVVQPPPSDAPAIVPLGQVPPLGVVPQKMHAWVIRPERFGEPVTSFVQEEMPVWDIGPDEVLVQVMAAGINYNAIWAGLGEPVNILKSHGLDFHIAGSDASGVVWKVGSAVTRWKVGDEVVIHCNHLVEPGASDLQTIWGYETPDGSFAQFTRVQGQQLLPKNPDLTWEAAASYGLVYFTAHRMLVDRAEIQPGEDVLVWGGAGGLGSFAIQLCKASGCRAIAVVSSDDKAEHAMALGAHGVINRKDFPDLQYRPGETEEQKQKRFGAMKAFGKKIWDVLGERKSVEVVFEHPGQRTFPASVWLASKFGRIVICGGDDRVRPDLRRASSVDEPEADHRLALRRRRQRRPRQQARDAGSGEAGAHRHLRVEGSGRGAPAHVPQRDLWDGVLPRRRSAPRAQDLRRDPRGHEGNGLRR